MFFNEEKKREQLFPFLDDLATPFLYPFRPNEQRDARRVLLHHENAPDSPIPALSCLEHMPQGMFFRVKFLRG